MESSGIKKMKKNKQKFNENRNDFDILVYLYGKNITAPSLAETAVNISKSEEIKLSDTKIRNTLDNYEEMGYVAYGFKRGRAYTYYLTKEGVKYVEQNLPEDEIEE